MTQHDLNHRDPEYDALVERLDALADSDTTAPDSGFEQRIMDSISKQIAPTPLSLQQHTEQTTPFTLGWKFNIAAALLVVASVSLLLWTSSTVGVQPAQNTVTAQQTLVSLEEDFDALYELTDFVDALDADMDELDLITDAMQTELSMPSVLIEFSDTSFTEGSL
jgi:hypothetical protein